MMTIVSELFIGVEVFVGNGYAVKNIRKTVRKTGQTF
jgi:hypothetical protein